MQQPQLKDLLQTSSPMTLFKDWWKHAQDQAENAENQANSMTVSTVDSSGQPSSRIVLLRQLTDEHLIFFTNYQSRKGLDLAQNPKVCLQFFWTHLTLQVQIQGVAEKTSRPVSEDYWNGRARESQVSQALSVQSQDLPPEQTLEELAAEFSRNHPDSVPCPDHWGGFQVTPTQWEFWIGRPNRLHHRVQFRKQEAGDWTPFQVYP